MKLPELLTRILILAAVAGVVGAPLYTRAMTPVIHARMAQTGGWSPDVIRAEVGKPLRLRFTSEDVVHGFAVGGMDMQSADILPGKVTELTLTFDKPGTYTFYCTRWCGLNHWRMRGTIEVGDASSQPEPGSAPLYVKLGLDIDASREAPVLPARTPSAIAGASQASNPGLSAYTNPDYYRSHSPYQAFDSLKGMPFTDTQRWDVVAYLWQSNTTPASLADGRGLFAQNCAACHGERGAGDGVFADDIASARTDNPMLQPPADFTDSRRMLAASPALLQGKILRGGMGTGMPMWGVIFTEKQIWDLIAYIYSFQFEYQK